jgi:glycosyltransferase involved in cell wall biosynthesis
MNILFLTIDKFNNIEDKDLYTDLLRQFRDNGHKVYVVNPREKRLNKPTEYIYENGVQFLRVKTGNITKTNIIEKGFSTITIEGLFLKAIKKYLKDVKFELIIYSTPPITFEKVIRYVKKRDNAKSYLLLKDIFPQNAVDLKMFSKNSLIYKYFRTKEKRLYEQSDFIGCMSRANVDYVLKNNPEISPEKVEVCPNTIEPLQVMKDKESINQIRNKYAIPLDKTVFIYGGNLGKPQGIDFVIDCLRHNIVNEEVYFIIAGDGTEYPKIKKFFDRENPVNAQLIKHLPKDDYETLVNSCDIGLIFLDIRFTIPNFPSRLLSYMQASMPVLAATDVNTDIGQVIHQGQFGFWCESNNVEIFTEKVQQLCDFELRKRMGLNSRKFLENNYKTEQSYEIIMRHFK